MRRSSEDLVLVKRRTCSQQCRGTACRALRLRKGRRDPNTGTACCAPTFAAPVQLGYQGYSPWLIGAALHHASLLVQPLGHLRQHIAENRHGGHGLTEVLGVHLVERVGLGVMPVEVALGDGEQSEAGDAFANDRTDVGIASASVDLACTETLQELRDLTGSCKGSLVALLVTFLVTRVARRVAQGEPEADRFFSTRVHFDGGHVMADIVTEPREYRVYGKREYQRLASISPSHIYNLRRTAGYRRHHLHVTKTRARAVAIGERRRPDPGGRPGYLRVDTVHQGDTETRQGLYHINAVDTVTQWQVVGCCETISEAHLIPVLEAILHQFPFRVQGFHSDNGSEFLNHRVEKLLNKLLVGEFTKSRAHRSTDNALVEGKNGAVVRKHMGHEPIAAEHAAELQRFYTAYFNPYLNYHRPCGFARVEVADNGKRRRRYRLEDYRTPYEKLRSLDEWEAHLKEGISAGVLAQQARRLSDTECALRMQAVKRKLLAQCRSRW